MNYSPASRDRERERERDEEYDAVVGSRRAQHPILLFSTIFTLLVRLSVGLCVLAIERAISNLH